MPDFVLNVESGREVSILQLTDMQIINPGEARSERRLNGNTTPLTEKDLYEKCYKYIEKAIKDADPDLIIITGDFIYGEFDDSGENFKKLINFVESFNIPWAPVFGNHDNESMKGVTWQCEQFENAENCLFKRGTTTGNGNYSIGIAQDGKLIKIIFMMDSNGCGAAYEDYYGALDANGNPLTYNANEKVKISAGFAYDQMDWLEQECIRIDDRSGHCVSKFLATHIPIMEFAKGAFASGYQTTDEADNDELYTLSIDKDPKYNDFGTKGEVFKGIYDATGLWRVMKENNFDGVFVGHSHKNSLSVLYDGIRLTFGLKTGTFDRYDSSMLGGTEIALTENTFTVKHLYY